MISLQTFLLGLLVVSTLTGLVTEAVKNILSEYNKTYRSNTLTGIIAAILSIAVSVVYTLLTNIGFTTETIVYIVTLIFMSWLGAMVGYDKIVQAFDQFKNYGKESK